jgi:hypothetical protein
MPFLRVTRRSFLSGLGAGTAAIIARPLVRECFGQGMPPRRLLVVYMPNTSIRASWLPGGGRTPLTKQGDARQFTLKACNETLAPVREQMTLVTGLDLKKIQGCNHGSAIANLMTGSGSNAKGSTIDQVLLDRSPLLKGTQVASLQLGTDSRADPGKNGISLRVMSYDLKGAPMPPELEPVKTYNRIFSPLVPVAGAGDQKAMLERTLAREKSVLDFLGGDLGRLQQRLPAAQREKLDQHLSGLRELERTLSHEGSLAPGSLPGPPEAVPPNISTNHKKIVDQYMLLMKLALQFDITRVITFMYASGNSQVSLGDFMPGYAVGPLHRLAHAYKAPALTQATRWYCQLTAAFLNELAAVKEADGSSLLDNTLVPFFSEVAQYHEHNDVPFALFGGKKLGHTGGRCLTYPGRTPNDVWIDVAKAFSVNLPTFGDPALNAGALPELFG